MEIQVENGHLEKFGIGQRFQVDYILTQSDLDRFAALTGDDNPIHVNPAFAARTKFGRPVAHGMLLYSMVCAVIGRHIPGASKIQQMLKFPNPTFTGEKVRVQIEVENVDRVKKVLNLLTQVIQVDGRLGLEGHTRVILQRTHLPSARPPGEPYQITDQGFKGLALGQMAETKRVYTAQDLAEYADLTGDTNPLIIDAAFARRQGLAGLVIPDGLLGGLFSKLLGTRLPGPGTNYLKQNLYFGARAHPGQEIRAAVEIQRIRTAKQLINLKTICTEQAGQIICQGDALVLVSDLQA